jgi:hypothetical protein
MNGTKKNFLELGCFFIIVKKLPEEIIEQAIQAFAKEDDAYDMGRNSMIYQQNLR